MFSPQDTELGFGCLFETFICQAAWEPEGRRLQKRKKIHIYPRSHLKYRATLSVNVNECNFTNETECLEYKPEEDLSMTN